MLRCRETTDHAERPGCFDAKLDALAGQLERREVVTADRQEAREARRTLLGLTLPDIGLFDGGDDARDDDDDVDAIEGLVASATRDANSPWLVRLESGQVWRQSASRPIVAPRAGSRW